MSGNLGLPAVTLAGLGVALLFFANTSQMGVLLLLAYLAAAWLLIIAFLFKSVNRSEEKSDLDTLFRTFRHRVDLAKQSLGIDKKYREQHVLRLFDELNAEVSLLLAKGDIEISQVKQKAMIRNPAAIAQGNHWRLPDLNELGYVVDACNEFSPDYPVLALYKISGEEPRQDGAIVDSYTILKEGSSQSFSGAFAAKIRSPYTKYVVATIEHTQRRNSPNPACATANK